MDPNIIVLIIMASMFFLFLIVVLWMTLRMNKMKKAQDHLLALLGNEETANHVLQLAESHQMSQKDIRQLQKELALLRDKQKSCFDRVNIVRYYAAGENEAKMSYSVGLSNENEDGLIITGLHYRAGVNMYFKEVREGVGDFPLSKEEKAAIDRSKISKVRN